MVNHTLQPVNNTFLHDTTPRERIHFEELNAEIRDFCEERDWEQYHTPKDLSIGLVTESSELLELFRLKDGDEQEAILQDPEQREAVENELADVLGNHYDRSEY